MKLRVTTTAQVERCYDVMVDDDLNAELAERQARSRLRTFLSDPKVFNEGVVMLRSELQRDATPQRITGIKKPGKEEATKEQPPA